VGPRAGLDTEAAGKIRSELSSGLYCRVNHFTRQYNPEDSSEHHTRRRENLKSHTGKILSPLLGIEPQSPGRLARSQTIY
jgi:hypothetical protein